MIGKFDNINRRDFIKRSAITSAAAYLGLNAGYSDLALGSEPPPETTRLRIRQWKPACWAPIHVAEPLLREEGFTDIQYPSGPGPKAIEMFKNGEIDITPTFAPFGMVFLERSNSPFSFLSGLHVGCYSLIGSDRVNSIREIKGKTVWTGSVENNGPHMFFKTILSYVGLNPDTDVNYLWVNKDEAMELFKNGKIDAFISFPPGPQELVAKGIGKVLVDTNVDKPWSQYFCCMIIGHNEFIEKNPIATKRALRAILKANDIVANDPSYALQVLQNKKIWKKAETKYILQALKEIPYAKWRDYNPEETIRFYAIRLSEIGMLNSLPENFIKQHTNWNFLNGLKKELAVAF